MDGAHPHAGLPMHEVPVPRGRKRPCWQRSPSRDCPAPAPQSISSPRSPDPGDLHRPQPRHRLSPWAGSRAPRGGGTEHQTGAMKTFPRAATQRGGSNGGDEPVCPKPPLLSRPHQRSPGSEGGRRQPGCSRVTPQRGARAWGRLIQGRSVLWVLFIAANCGLFLVLFFI